MGTDEKFKCLKCGYVWSQGISGEHRCSDYLYDNLRRALEHIDYLLDCTLATVARMSMMPKPPKGEFRRQCRIAQKAIDYLGRDYNYRSRGKEIIESGLSVEDYYVQDMVNRCNCWMLAGGK